PKQFPVQNERLKTAKPDDFKKIPGSPVAYWISRSFLDIYSSSTLLSNIAHSLQGMITGDNNKFLRLWFEVKKNVIAIDKSSMRDIKDEYWIPY
ncbi:BREX-1 system adenine-specific DNA-methyltransferase PglX, partial [Streptococcus suis]